MLTCRWKTATKLPHAGALLGPTRAEVDPTQNGEQDPSRAPSHLQVYDRADTEHLGILAQGVGVLRSRASWEGKGGYFWDRGPLFRGMVSVDEGALGNPRYSKKPILCLKRHFCPKLTRLPPFRTDEKGSLLQAIWGS